MTIQLFVGSDCRAGLGRASKGEEDGVGMIGARGTEVGALGTHLKFALGHLSIEWPKDL